MWGCNVLIKKTCVKLQRVWACVSVTKIVTNIYIVPLLSRDALLQNIRTIQLQYVIQKGETITYSSKYN